MSPGLFGQLGDTCRGVVPPLDWRDYSEESKYPPVGSPANSPKIDAMRWMKQLNHASRVRGG
jgi:hypothetical protein